MKKYTGILKDNRKKSEQIKNFDSREISLGAVEYTTRAKAIKIAKKYITRDQYRKSSCVPSSVANALWNTEQKILADEYLYTQRINKPQEGCYWYDIANKVVEQGMAERSVLPELKTEAEANALKITPELRENAKPQKQASYIFFDDPNIDQIVGWVNKGYAVPFSIFSTINEWSKEYPEIIDPNLTIEKASVNHAICAIPNTGYIYKKKKYFILTDSAHFGNKILRHLSEDFVEKRAKHGIVFTDLSKEVQPITIKYMFTKDLTVGDSGEEVLKLQEVLQELGFFPIQVTPTGYFGGITRQAVKDFQEAYKTDILISLGLKSGTGYFGSSSRNKLNKLLNK